MLQHVSVYIIHHQGATACAAGANNIVFNTWLFEMIVGVLTICHLVLQMQTHVISLYGVCYVKDHVYVPPLPASIPELKVRIRTAIETITADTLQTLIGGGIKSITQQVYLMMFIRG